MLSSLFQAEGGMYGLKEEHDDSVTFMTLVNDQTVAGLICKEHPVGNQRCISITDSWIKPGCEGRGYQARLRDYLVWHYSLVFHTDTHHESVKEFLKSLRREDMNLTKVWGTDIWVSTGYSGTSDHRVFFDLPGFGEEHKHRELWTYVSKFEHAGVN